MRFSRARTEEVVRAIVHEVRAERLTFMAGSIAYHAFISILPVLLLVLTLVQRTQNVALQDSVVDVMQVVLTEQASEVIQQGLTEADASVSLLGVGFLVWGSLRIFRGLDTAFSDIYETGRENTFLDQVGDGLLLLLTVAVAIVGTSLVGSAVDLGGQGAAPVLLRSAATALGLFVVFYPMYYIFPDTDVTPLEVVPGTAFAALGVTVAQFAFTTVKAGSTGGNLVASILLLLSWLYVVGLLVLLGAAVNAVLSNRSADVDIDPVVGGVERRVAAGAGTYTVDPETLDALAERLGTAEGSLTLSVDGDSTTVDRPETAVVDRSPGVFGLDDTVTLTLRWRPEEE